MSKNSGKESYETKGEDLNHLNSAYPSLLPNKSNKISHKRLKAVLPQRDFDHSQDIDETSLKTKQIENCQICQKKSWF